MQAQEPGPYGWYWGVVTPIDVARMSAEETDRRKRLDAELPKRLDLGNSGDWSVQYGRPREPEGNWESLVPELFEECEAGGGTITDYYAGNIIDIASKAIPVINAVELEEAGTLPGSSGR